MNGKAVVYNGCKIFPDDSYWYQDVSGSALDTTLNSQLNDNMSPGTGLHPDWGTFGQNYGIPITSGPDAANPAKISFHTSYGAGESEKIPGCGVDYCYPIPLDAKIEGGTGASQGSDRHILFLSTTGAPDHCTLYELYNAYNPSGGGYSVGSAAVFKLDTNNLRTEGWTSADAAGLPIMPGLVRYDEVKAGLITHAIRFTMGSSRNAYIHPATHSAGDPGAGQPPMGLRLRLKASFDDSALPAPVKVITTAMKKYGIILADNGSDWYISGETNDGWESILDDLVSGLKKVKGGDFEIVKTGDVVIQTGD